MFKIGHGYDIHRLVFGRKLILCGQEIDFNRGLLGHSDGDVCVHALMDSLLGAAGLGDIGKYFPDKDPLYEGACSLKLLKQVINMVKSKGYFILNIDITIVLEEPKILKYVENMKQNLANVLGIDKNCINIKAKTNEKLGEVGKGRAVVAFCVCILGCSKNKNDAR